MYGMATRVGVQLIGIPSFGIIVRGTFQRTPRRTQCAMHESLRHALADRHIDMQFLC